MARPMPREAPVTRATGRSIGMVLNWLGYGSRTASMPHKMGGREVTAFSSTVRASVTATPGISRITPRCAPAGGDGDIEAVEDFVALDVDIKHAAAGWKRFRLGEVEPNGVSRAPSRAAGCD